MFPETTRTAGSNERKQRPSVNTADASSASPTAEFSEDIRGVEIAEYAARHELSEGEVWDRIRVGTLVARSEKGRIFVYDKTPELVATPPVEAQVMEDHSLAASPSMHLPPLPYHGGGGSTTTSLTITHQQPSDLSLLMDHLNLAKEENREILQLTQESMNHLTRLTESIILSKDEIIRMKQAELHKMETALLDAERKCLHLAQEVEDLKILTKALGES